MSLLYSSVSQGAIVLARYATCMGNFQEVSDQILTKIQLESCPSRMTYTHDQFLTHYLVGNGFVYLCMTDDSFDRYRAFAFLEDVKQKFERVTQASPRDTAPYAWNDDFADVLCERMEAHNNSASGDPKVAFLNTQVQEIQQTLVRNIEELSNRGERLELLVDKTNSLASRSTEFHNLSQAVARRAWWQNARVWVVLFVVGGISIYFVGAIICGWSWKCKH